MRLLAGIVALLLAACAAAEAPAQPEAPPVAERRRLKSIAPVVPPPPRDADARLAPARSRKAALRFAALLPGARSSSTASRSATPTRRAGPSSASPASTPRARAVEARRGGRAVAITATQIAPREFDIQRVDGLPQQTVTPTDPDVLARIQREAAMKRKAGTATPTSKAFSTASSFRSKAAACPARWGNQRVLNGVPASPHFGYDIAAPEGTPIRAPAAGVVTLAQPDMHYEGGLVFIDHGQGLITMYLHMSRLDVRVGDRVEQGQVIGAVGSQRPRHRPAPLLAHEMARPPARPQRRDRRPGGGARAIAGALMYRRLPAGRPVAFKD